MKQKEDNKNRKKMNTLELLYNKALMKAAGEADEHVKKTKLWGPHNNKLSKMWFNNFYSYKLGGKEVLIFETNWAQGIESDFYFEA